MILYFTSLSYSNLLLFSKIGTLFPTYKYTVCSEKFSVRLETHNLLMSIPCNTPISLAEVWLWLKQCCPLIKQSIKHISNVRPAI